MTINWAKGRTLPPSIADAKEGIPQFVDDPAQIGQLMGGREWFLSTGCWGIHRIGQFKGLGWRLAGDAVTTNPNINGVKIIRYGDTFQITFGSFDPGPDVCSPAMFEPLLIVNGIKPDELKSAYEKVVLDV